MSQSCPLRLILVATAAIVDSQCRHRLPSHTSVTLKSAVCSSQSFSGWAGACSDHTHRQPKSARKLISRRPCSPNGGKEPVVNQSRLLSFQWTVMSCIPNGPGRVVAHFSSNYFNTTSFYWHFFLCYLTQLPESTFP